MAGYSGTPLAHKLGLKPPMNLLVVGAPRAYRAWLGALPAGVRLVSSADGEVRAAHVFVAERASLEKRLRDLRRRLDDTGFLWVSWPKKAAKVPTDITEDTVRQVALPLGFVDIKVCAVSDVWSGLKLVVRKEERR